MTDLLAEFTIEPFEPSAPGPHVRAAIDAAEAGAVDGVTVDVGPFGTAVAGPADEVLELVRAVTEAAIGTGATRVSLQISVRR